MPFASFGHGRRHLLLQTLSEAVVEEEELAVRKQAAEQNVDPAALQQDLEENGCYGDNLLTER